MPRQRRLSTSSQSSSSFAIIPRAWNGNVLYRHSSPARSRQTNNRLAPASRRKAGAAAGTEAGTFGSGCRKSRALPDIHTAWSVAWGLTAHHHHHHRGGHHGGGHRGGGHCGYRLDPARAVVTTIVTNERVKEWSLKHRPGLSDSGRKCWTAYQLPVSSCWERTRRQPPGHPPRETDSSGQCWTKCCVQR